MGETKMPFLMDPEVKTEAENIPEAIKAEELAYEYLVSQEELLSIFDEIKEYLSYEDILNSDFVKNFQSNLDLQLALDQFIKENKKITHKKEEKSGAIDRDLSRDYNRLNELKKRGEISIEQMNEELISKHSEEAVTDLYRTFSEMREVGATLTDQEISESLKQLGFEDEQTIQSHLLITNLKKHSDEANEADHRAANEAAKDGKRYEPREKHHVLFGDFIQLWKANEHDKKALKGAIFSPLLRNIKSKAEKDFFESQSSKVSESDQQKIIKARVVGEYSKLGYILKGRFSKLLNKLSNFGPEDLDKIKTFGVAAIPQIREQVQLLHEFKEAVEIAQIGKETSSIRSSDATAKLLGAEKEEIDFVKDIMEDILEEEFGEKIRLGMEEETDEQGNIVNKEFLAAYVNYKRELKNLYEMLNDGRIVETEAVKDMINSAMPYLTKNPPTIVYFNGDYGTGKTAMAVHISRTRFGQEPIIVSGSKFLEPDQLTEELKISKRDMVDVLNEIRLKRGNDESFSEDTPLEELIAESIGDRSELKADIIMNRLLSKYLAEKDLDKQNADIANLQDSQEFKSFVENNRGTVSEEESSEIDKMVDDLYSNQVQGRYVLGAMYKAMKEGRPLIIDEANAISQEVLIAFNDLLTRKHGDKVMTRTDEGEITINRGYCVMWTGNTGRGGRYLERKGMDPATFSRIAPILVEYLPQSVTSQSIEPLLERLNMSRLADETYDETGGNVEQFIRESKLQAESDQIFQILLIKMLNGRLGAEMLCKKDSSGNIDRYSFVKDLYRLSVGSRMIMNMFEGKTEGVPDLPNLEKIIGSSEKTVLAEKLKSSNLSIRELIDNIVGGYIDEGCSMDLEYYLYKFVQKQALNGEEQAIVYSILQQADLFKPSEGWIDYQTIANDTALSTGEEKLQKLKTELQKSPVDSVEKYKKIEVNGNYVSLLNMKEGEGDDYVLEYLSSPEIMQLVFGYLPPRKKAEYDKYYETKNRLEQASMTESEQDVETRERIKRITESIQENIALLRVNPGWQEASSDEKRKLLDHIKSLGIHDDETRNKMSLETFIESANLFVEVIIDYLEEKRKMTPEEAEQIRNQETTEGKLEMLKQIQNRINNEKKE